MSIDRARPPGPASADLRVLREALGLAADSLRRDTWSALARPRQVETKSRNDYVTELDRKVEREIRELLRARCAGDGVVGEEAGASNAAGRRVWYVDPVDGTRNLVAGRPEVAVSVALYERDRPVVAGLAFPSRGLEIVMADGEVSVSPERDAADIPSPAATLAEALVGVPGDFRPDSPPQRLAEVVSRLAGRIAGVRVTGALAYDLGCLVLGELDLRLSLSAKAVDVAAGAALVAASGGAVSDLEGRPWTLQSGTILAARTPQLHRAALEALGGAGGAS